MDNIDRKILKALQRDCSGSIAEVAERASGLANTLLATDQKAGSRWLYR